MFSRPRLHKGKRKGGGGRKVREGEGGTEGGILYALTLGLMEKQLAADERAHNTIYPPVRRGALLVIVSGVKGGATSAAPDPR